MLLAAIVVAALSWPADSCAQGWLGKLKDKALEKAKEKVETTVENAIEGNDAESPEVQEAAVAEPADEWSWQENDSIAEDPVPEWNQTWNEYDEEPVSEWNWSGNGDTAEAWAAPETNGSFADGVYTGSGTGLRGTVQVSVTVEGGRIADITILSFADDAPYFAKAQNTVIANILAAQSVNVSTVSGATYSSNGILEATANALGLDFTNPNSSGTGRGGRGRH